MWRWGRKPGEKTAEEIGEGTRVKGLKRPLTGRERGRGWVRGLFGAGRS